MIWPLKKEVHNKGARERPLFMPLFPSLLFPIRFAIIKSYYKPWTYKLLEGEQDSKDGTF